MKEMKSFKNVIKRLKYQNKKVNKKKKSVNLLKSIMKSRLHR